MAHRIFPPLAAGLLAAACLASPLHAQQAPNTTAFVPDTISAEAQAAMQALTKMGWEQRRFPQPDDVAGWKRLRDAQIAGQVGPGEKVAAREGVTLQDKTLGGVPVLEIVPAQVKDSKRVILYTHGGAYTMSSARGRLLAMPSLARHTGLKVISVDYTTAPAADWRKIQGQVVAVIRALLAQGYAMDRIALIGDSAGGGLALSTVQNLRQQGLGMPAALVLWSPWADLTDRGDTAVTLKDADPILSYDLMLKNSALAYANGLDLKDPRVSPIYGEFGKGFPPTLIQEGTRTTFLSTSVRLYRKLDEAGLKPVIDMYEGMPHVFQDMPAPEAAIAIRKSAEFISARLR